MLVPGKLPTEPTFIIVKAKLNTTVLPPITAKLTQVPNAILAVGAAVGVESNFL
jgi:hypothetical protein